MKIKQFICHIFLSWLFMAVTFPVNVVASTANIIANFGNITVMELTGNYDNPDLTHANSEPRAVIAREFFRTHPDDYDFLIYITNFDFAMPPNAVAFYTPVRNDTAGIGQDFFDNSSLFGSAGRLQGTIDMGNIANMVTNPLDERFDFTMGTLSHEMAHRWLAHVHYQDSSGQISDNLLGKEGSHWSFLLDTAGSLMYGNRWQDNGDGTFTSLTGRRCQWPINLTHLGRKKISVVVCASIDSFHLPA